MPSPLLGQTALELRNSFLEVQMSTLSETNDPSLIKSNEDRTKGILFQNWKYGLNMDDAKAILVASLFGT